MSNFIEDLFNAESGNRLINFSNKLEYLVQKEPQINKEDISYIKSENLRYNLSQIISQIILNLKFIDRSRPVFESIINKYNEDQRTKLKIEDFFELLWIREIVGEIVIAPNISQMLYNTIQQVIKNREVIIEPNHQDFFNCLKIYYRKCFHDAVLVIEKDDLESILNNFSLNTIDINYLLKIGIISWDKDKNQFYWNRYSGGKYGHCLANEIFSILWLNTGDWNRTEEEYKYFFKLINGTNLQFTNFTDFLQINEIREIQEFSIKFLNDETDLDYSEDEPQKIFMDLYYINHMDHYQDGIFLDLPFKSGSYEFIKGLSENPKYMNSFFEKQKLRKPYSKLTDIIMYCDDTRNNWQTPYYRNFTQYKHTLEILKNDNKPFLVWVTYQKIYKEHPQVIPFLLLDFELSPITHYMIDSLRFKDAFCENNAINESVASFSGFELKNDIWYELMDLFIEVDRLEATHKDKFCKACAQMLVELSDRAFNRTRGYRDYRKLQIAYKNRLDSTIAMLTNKHMSPNHYKSEPQFEHYSEPWPFYAIVPSIVKFILEVFPRYSEYKGFLNFDHDLIYLIVELLKLLSSPKIDSSLIKPELISETISNSIKSIYSFIIKYFKDEFISVEQILPRTIKSDIVKRGYNVNGYNHIDWGYIYSQYRRLDLLEANHNSFLKSLDFDTSENIFDPQNEEQLIKIKLYLRSLLYAYISISKDQSLYGTYYVEIDTVLIKLNKYITQLALRFNSDDIANNKIDVFNEARVIFRSEQETWLVTILFQAVNLFCIEDRTTFITDFFIDSLDISRMLIAENIFDSQDITELISSRIETINTNDFIDRLYSIPTLISTLTEAVNSENHWELAILFMDKIYKHIKNNPQESKDHYTILFEIELLLAFKEEDLIKLDTLSLKMGTNYFPNVKEVEGELKTYYHSLFNIFYKKEYDKAITTLKELMAKDPNNVRYAYYLYYASTLKYVEFQDTKSLRRANKYWDQFSESVSHENISELSRYGNAVNMNKVLCAVTIDDPILFDQHIVLLSNKDLYDTEFIQRIYEYYINRDLTELARDYISKAQMSLLKSKRIIPDNIQTLFNNFKDDHYFANLKNQLRIISTETYTNLPKIIYDSLNPQNSINEFLLHEIILALKVMLKKIHAITTIKHENRYNDFLYAILRLRFPIWGWNITDEPRSGNSSTGIDAGEVDLEISSPSEVFAIIEALILRRKQTKYVKDHVLRGFKYNSTIQRYYIVIYYKGEESKYEYTWECYKNDVLAADFQPQFTIDKDRNFTSLEKQFPDTNDFKIAKTYHKSDVEIFHIMVKLNDNDLEDTNNRLLLQNKEGQAALTFSKIDIRSRKVSGDVLYD